MKFLRILVTIYYFEASTITFKNPQVTFQGFFGLHLASRPSWPFSIWAARALEKSSITHCICAFTELKFTTDSIDFFLLELSGFFQRVLPFKIKVFGIQSCITFLLLGEVVKSFIGGIPTCQIFKACSELLLLGQVDLEGSILLASIGNE